MTRYQPEGSIRLVTTYSTPESIREIWQDEAGDFWERHSGTEPGCFFTELEDIRKAHAFQYMDDQEVAAAQKDLGHWDPDLITELADRAGMLQEWQGAEENSEEVIALIAEKLGVDLW